MKSLKEEKKTSVSIWEGKVRSSSFVLSRIIPHKSLMFPWKSTTDSEDFTNFMKSLKEEKKLRKYLGGQGEVSEHFICPVKTQEIIPHVSLEVHCGSLHTR